MIDRSVEPFSHWNASHEQRQSAHRLAACRVLRVAVDGLKQEVDAMKREMAACRQPVCDGLAALSSHIRAVLAENVRVKRALKEAQQKQDANYKAYEREKQKQQVALYDRLLIYCAGGGRTARDEQVADGVARVRALRLRQVALRAEDGQRVRWGGETRIKREEEDH